MQEYGQDYDAAEQNKLALAAKRMQMQQAEAGAQDQQRIRGLASQFGGDENALIKALRGGGYFEQAGGLEKQIGERAKSQADTAKSTQELKSKQLADAEKRLQLAGQAFGYVKDNPSAESAASVVQHLQQNGIWDDKQAAAAMAEIQANPTPEGVRMLATRAFQGVLDAKEQLPKYFQQGRGSTAAIVGVSPVSGASQDVQSAPITQSADNAASQATALAGQQNTANIAAAGRAQSAAHFGVTSGLSRERLNFDQNKPPGVEGKPMTAQQEAKYRSQIAKDYQSANTNLANLDEVMASIDEVRKAPGLKGATGLQSYIPSMPNSNAAQAEVKLKNLEGKITQLGKAAAAQGGAVGPMAVQEWKIVRDMIAAIEPQKGDKALIEQIGLVEAATQGAAERIRDAYGKHYGADFERYPQFQEIGGKKPAAPKPAGAPAKVASDADYNALPSGSMFVGPDGKTRRKP